MCAFAQLPVDENRLRDMAARYKAATAEKDKMAVCIEVMDNGLLQRGTSVKTIDAIFGSHLANDLPRQRGAVGKGAVRFAEQPPPTGEAVANPYVGWYLGLEFDSEGSIRKYYLSNQSK